MSAITRRRQPALDELFQRHRSRLKSVIGNVVHEEGEADDVLQEIMIQIWREAARYSPKAGKPLGWVVTLARRRAIDRVRRRQAYCRAKDRFSEQLEERSNGHRTFSGNEEVARVDLKQFLKQQLRRLPPLQREAIELAFFKGMSHREIASATSTPLGTVKTRLELGLQKLTQSVRPLRHKI
ncbi:MAG: sigma-70 family RNA polymerase sigma factor [Verrucomicrobiota bacterium]|nr:sigma-70 family RNA polymerase sigma factor [Verrucomicrobiota bacterium]